LQTSDVDVFWVVTPHSVAVGYHTTLLSKKSWLKLGKL